MHQKNKPGRVYLGILTSKSTVTLPIKAQSIIMSEIFKIKSSPASYNLTSEEKNNLQDEIEPYWTFVSYFTDLQLLSKFTNYYTENIMENVQNWSRTKIFNSDIRASNSSRTPAFRLFPITSTKTMTVSGISIYCANAVGRVKIVMYRGHLSAVSVIYKSDFQNCRVGENIFDIPNDIQVNIKPKEILWVGIVNENKETIFESVLSGKAYLENPTIAIPDVFSDTISNLNKPSDVHIRFSLNSPARLLSEKNNIQLSSATKSEELPNHLERLKERFEVDSLQTSPVFGTGIDIDRLGIMEVMNQPKTNSGYIQSSGRVGRTRPGLVINWLRAGRARDLSHYENFIGYHRMLHRFVEPVTASPFSRKAIELCLGPVLVSILRNARVVDGVPVNSLWIGSKGPERMAEHNNDPEVNASGEALKNIASSKSIAEFRRMPPEQFEHTFNELKSRWHETAKNMQEEQSKIFEYAERRPHVSPSKNVVLGSPNHADLGLDYVYGNVPNSLRQTESTATFYGSKTDMIQIRPSQFITRYGPGALISGKTSTWIVPALKDLISNLQDKGKFEEKDTSGNQRLYKYEINDSRMNRILHRFNSGVDEEKLKLFSLPTNSSLTVRDLEPIFRCRVFPMWAICHSRRHPLKRFLIRTSYDEQNRLVVRCPECQRLSLDNDEFSVEFYNSRYVISCKEGHLDDVNWKYEIHKSDNSNCLGDVFEWITSDSNDNAEIVCFGHWDKNSNNFVRSSCKASTSYIALKTRSKEGQIVW